MDKYTPPKASDREVSRIITNIYDVLNKLSSRVADLYLKVMNVQKVTTVETGWDDLRFSAGNITPIGASGNPGISNADDEYLGTLLFDAAATEKIHVIAQMPHSWKEGSDIEPHIHWMKTVTGSGNVYWQYEVAIANPGAAFSAVDTQGAYTETTTTGSSSEEDTFHFLTPLPTISMSGKKISCILLIRIARVGGNGNDNYANDARLLEFDIHYQVDSFGSRFEYVK